MSLVHGSDLAVGMRISYVLRLLLCFCDETRTKLVVVWNLQWTGSSQCREVVYVPLWISCQGHENDRGVSRWQCWCRDRVLAAFAGARLCLLQEGTHAYCTILFWEIGNRLLQSLRQAKSAFTTPPSRVLLSVLRKRSYVSNFPKQNQVSDIVLSLHAKFHAQKCSLTSPELLLQYPQQTYCQRLYSIT